MGQSCSNEESCNALENGLGIKKPFSVLDSIQSESALPRIVCLIHQEWLATQIRANVVCSQDQKPDDSLLPEEQTTLLQPSSQFALNGWQRVVITVIKKPLKKIKIQKCKQQNVEQFTLYDFLHSLSNDNDASLREYMCRRFSADSTNESSHQDYLDEEKLSTLIQETFGIQLKFISKDHHAHFGPDVRKDDIESPSKAKKPIIKQLHHIVPLLLACKNSSHIFLIESTPSYTLHDVLAFSPAIASNSSAKYLFLLYQILKINAIFQEIGFSISPSLSFNDIYVTSSLWLSISAFQIDHTDIIQEEEPGPIPVVAHWPIEAPSIISQPFPFFEDLHEYTTRWVNCKLTTFDYLLILNTLAGRRMKDPAHHPIFPWVMDFTKPDGGFRDLMRSKFRLCKSDTQLDITYNQPALEDARKGIQRHVAHHISDDPLTAISYYVYSARRVSKDTLCKTVRSRWIPEEYPSSIERLYSWTPEECIPEFYSDPLIFKSVHSDLPDLGLPAWAPTAEEFIKHHRDVLEGHQVSRYLHFWIDLIFGYKLSGLASVDAKNVYLSLVDDHNHLTNCGVLQLFSRPHPARKLPNLVDEHVIEPGDTYSEAFDSSDANVFADYEASETTDSDMLRCVNGKSIEADVRSSKPTAIRRDIWSIDSAIDEASQIEEQKKPEENDTDSRMKPPLMLLPGLKLKIDTLFEGGGNESKTTPSYDFRITIDTCSDFIGQLEAVEKELKFQCHVSPVGVDGIGDYKFGSVFENRRKEKNHGLSEYEISKTTENKDILVLANLLIELALHDYVRLRRKPLNFEERLQENVRLMKTNLHKFPSLLTSILESWLGSPEKPLVESEGVIAGFFKKPTLLLNQFINPFPCPKYFPALHNLLSILYPSDILVDEAVSIECKNSIILPIVRHLPAARNIIRAAHFVPLLIEEIDAEGIDLLLTLVLPLFSNQDTKLAAFLHIFPPLGNVMGSRRSMKSFYEGLQRLFDSSADTKGIDGRLLDQSFISKVITIFGLSCFLDCFMPFVVDGLVEATSTEESKEKNEMESMEVENPSYDSEKTEREVEENATNFLEKETENRDKAESDEFVGRKASVLEDDNNVNVFEPKLLPGKRKVRPGVFSRLESVSENAVVEKERGAGSSKGSSLKPNIFAKADNQPPPSNLDNAKDSLSKSMSSDVFFSIVEKSEVIYNENGNSSPQNAFFECSSESNSGMDEIDYLSDVEESSISERCKQNDNESSIENKFPDIFSDSREKKPSSMTTSKETGDTVGGKDAESHNKDSESSYDVVSSDTVQQRSERRSTLSEAVRNMETATKTHQATIPVKDTKQYEVHDQGNTDEELVTGIEDFSIDSMYSEDEGKSFLIRRSSLKMNDRSDSSPFMVLPSDVDVEEDCKINKPSEQPKSESFEEYTEIPTQSIPETDALEDISKIAAADNAGTPQISVRAEELALASLKWICPWLGPVLTSKYVVSPILKKMPKVWVSMKKLEYTTDDLLVAVKSKGKFLVDCLVDVARIYGSAIVLQQYLPYCSRAVNIAMKASIVSAYNEGQLFSALEILAKTLVTLKPETLTDKMEALSQEIFEPLLRLLSSFKQFSSGFQSRSLLLHSLVGLMAALSQTLGQLDAREVMTPLLQRFFSCFDCVYRLDEKSGTNVVVVRKYSFLDDDYQEVSSDIEKDIATGVSNSCKDSMTSAKTSSQSGKESCDPKRDGDQATEDSSKLMQKTGDETTSQKTKDIWMEGNDDQHLYKDLYSSFTTALAHYSYVLFCRVLGDNFVSRILYNEKLIWQLCSNFDENLTLTSNSETVLGDSFDSQGSKTVGNAGKRKEPEKGAYMNHAGPGKEDHNKRFARKRTVSEQEEEEPVYRSSWQHMDGEWLSEWKERLDAKYDDRHLHFKGKRLQTYAGHSSAVRDIYIPDNEHYFLSASRDKSVKFWLLKNHGNGTGQLACMKTYDKHTKGVFAVQSIESKRFTVSCDGTVHVWDPIRSATLSTVDLGKNSSITSIRTLPVPNVTVAMATNEGTIRLYDVREKSVSSEWKLVSSSAAGSVKCLCVNETGTWIAAGFSSGFISVLDLRTGILRSQWKAHESEILQIEPYTDHNFLSSSNDLLMKMWNEDGSLALRFRRPPEPANCVTFCKSQCVWSTTSGNRIGITHQIENGASYESIKLPPEVFRGAISKLKVLPVNQLYLVGSENGNVVMFA
ncbi:WD repeat-containing protein 81-like isoform X2 [Rhopilema esculentum]|uniref:WD repeat-containing protein 81-like isoform X2 n=1 Tax=Rhopilema esculentum TaxID=499914 RepID=UPI0031D4F791